MTELLAVTAFSTDPLPQAQRHEAWQNRGWPTIGPIFDTRPSGAFFNRSDRFVLDQVVVHVSDMAAQTYRRTPSRIRSDDLDGLIVSLPVTGRMNGDFEGTDVVNQPGMLAVTDLARPHRHMSTDSRTIMLTVPRAALAADLPVDALHGRVAGGAMVDLLRSHLEAIHRQASRLTVAEAQALGPSVLGLLRLALIDPGEPARAEPQSGLFLQACHVVERNLASAELGAAMLCRILRVSRSALYRTFEPHGGVASFIRARRLDRAGELLRAGAGLTISSVGERVGFVDPGHFSRAFRAHHGVTPRGWRAAARDG